MSFSRFAQRLHGLGYNNIRLEQDDEDTSQDFQHGVVTFALPRVAWLAGCRVARRFLLRRA